MAEQKHIVIIGNGISGITAAKTIRKLSDHRITVISRESEFFYSRPALMYIYMGDMTAENTQPYEPWFWEKNRIDLKRDGVVAVDCEAKTLNCESGATITYDTLILATGATPNKFGWPGQDLDAVSGLYSLQDVQSMEKYSPSTKRAVIVGGGLIGVEMAEMFMSRGIAVTLLVRESAYWNNVLPQGEAEIVTKHVREHHIDLRLGEELKEILSDDHGRARAVITKNGEEITCQYVGLTAGVGPNIGFIKESAIECDRGILIDGFFNTNISDVYAIGDCAQFRHPPSGRRPIEQVWYTGRMHGETCAHTICGDKKDYRPGIWFNSAKFLDIEYQTYGVVMPTLAEGLEAFYWQDNESRRCFHAHFRSDDRSLFGLNVFGLRFRHNVCERWIHEKAPIEEVIADLGAANFDPEFFQEVEPQIVAAFNKKMGTNIVLRTSRGLFSTMMKNLVS